MASDDSHRDPSRHGAIHLAPAGSERRPAASLPLSGSALDAALGLNRENADPLTEERQLFWYRLGVVCWAPVQFLTLYALIWYLGRADQNAGSGRHKRSQTDAEFL